MSISRGEMEGLEKHANDWMESKPNENREKLAMIALAGIGLYLLHRASKNDK